MFVWHWLTVSFALIILELLLGASFIFLWLGLSAALVGMLIFLFPMLLWPYTIILFSILACTSVICGKLYGKYVKKPIDNASTLNQRTAQYIDQVFVLVEPIVNGRGKIRIGDSAWIVTGPDSPEGASVKVVGAIGVILQVMPVL